MSKYPALDAMGIQNPNEIARYALYMSDNTDVMRIVYTRKKGSILPVSKKFRFPRIKKNTVVDSGTRQMQVIYESSNEFRNALSELDNLLSPVVVDTATNKQLILEELRLLEEETELRINFIRSLMDEMN